MCSLKDSLCSTNRTSGVINAQHQASTTFEKGKCQSASVNMPGTACNMPTAVHARKTAIVIFRRVDCMLQAPKVDRSQGSRADPSNAREVEPRSPPLAVEFCRFVPINKVVA